MTYVTAHDTSGMARATCAHGALLMVVDTVDPTEHWRIDGLADGRHAVAPRQGASFIRGRYLDTVGRCPVDRGQPRPADLATPGVFMPSDACSGGPITVPEVYDPDQHGSTPAITTYLETHR